MSQQHAPLVNVFIAGPIAYMVLAAVSAVLFRCGRWKLREV